MIDAGADDCLLLPMTEEQAQAGILIAERQAIRRLRGLARRHLDARARGAVLQALRESEALFRAAFRDALGGHGLACRGRHMPIKGEHPPLRDARPFPRLNCSASSFPQYVAPRGSSACAPVYASKHGRAVH